MFVRSEFRKAEIEGQKHQRVEAKLIAELEGKIAPLAGEHTVKVMEAMAYESFRTAIRFSIDGRNTKAPTGREVEPYRLEERLALSAKQRDCHARNAANDGAEQEQTVAVLSLEEPSNYSGDETFKKLEVNGTTLYLKLKQQVARFSGVPDSAAPAGWYEKSSTALPLDQYAKFEQILKPAIDHMVATNAPRKSLFARLGLA